MSARFPLLLLAVSLAAGTSGPEGRTWVQGKGGVAAADKDCHCVEKSVAMGLGTGTWLTPRLGLEADFATLRLKDTEGRFSAPEHHGMVAGLYNLNPNGRLWFPYLRLGAGAAQVGTPFSLTPEAVTRLTLHGGLGLQVFLGERGLASLEARSVTIHTAERRSELQVLAGLGVRWGAARRGPAPPPPATRPTKPPPVPPTPPSPPGPAKPPPSATPKVAPPPPAPPKALPLGAPVLPSPAPSRAEAVLPPVPRLEALRHGNLPQAAAIGEERLQAIPKGRWTLRLLVATQAHTLQEAVAAFRAPAPDLFLLPLAGREDPPSYQLFLGVYATRAEAEQAARAVPARFREKGQKPLPMETDKLAGR